MQALLLRPGATAPFRRCVRDADKNVIRTLVFEPGKPVILGDADYAAVAADVGKALVIPQMKDGKPTTKAARQQESAGEPVEAGEPKGEPRGGARRRR